MNLIVISVWFWFSVFIDMSSVSQAHDFHLSRCEINYETKSGAIQIAAHIFIDDLEVALALNGRKNLYLCTNKEHPDGELAIENYINQMLKIKAGGKHLSFALLGKETSKDQMAVWCYLEVEGISNISTIEIENKILTEVFNDQKNIVDFTVDKKKTKFTIFDNKKIRDIYQW